MAVNFLRFFWVEVGFCWWGWLTVFMSLTTSPVRISEALEVLAFANATQAYRSCMVVGGKGAAAGLAAFHTFPAAVGFDVASEAAHRISLAAVLMEQDAAAWAL